jgi:ATP-dependent Clp protease ATP-binding subunit ClpX
MMDIMFEIPSRDDVDKCIITKETIEQKDSPKLLLTSDKKQAKNEANAS